MSTDAPRADRLIGAALLAVGVYLLALSIFQLLAPGAFFDAIGPFGDRNDHYIRDGASFGLALAVLALVAAWAGSWRLPALVTLVVHFTVHAANHLADIGEADPGWVGPADFAALALAAAALAGLLAIAWRRERGGAG